MSDSSNKLGLFLFAGLLAALSAFTAFLVFILVGLGKHGQLGSLGAFDYALLIYALAHLVNAVALICLLARREKLSRSRKWLLFVLFLAIVLIVGTIWSVGYLWVIAFDHDTFSVNLYSTFLPLLYVGLLVYECIYLIRRYRVMGK
jgi:hypothetical protein